MANMIWLYETESLQISFNPALARMVRPQRTPQQRLLVAESTHSYVYQIAQLEELLLNIDFEDIPEEDTVSPSTSGYNSLQTFLIDVLNWSEKQFTFTDPDGDVYFVRYWGGFESIQEASGRSAKKGRWSGQVVLREIPQS